MTEPNVEDKPSRKLGPKFGPVVQQAPLDVETKPELNRRRVSDKVIEYIEANVSDDCFDCPHMKWDHKDGRLGCNVPGCNCTERKPTNGDKLWKEACEKDKLGQW